MCIKKPSSGATLMLKLIQTVEGKACVRAPRQVEALRHASARHITTQAVPGQACIALQGAGGDTQRRWEFVPLLPCLLSWSIVCLMLPCGSAVCAEQTIVMHWAYGTAINMNGKRFPLTQGIQKEKMIYVVNRQVIYVCLILTFHSSRCFSTCNESKLQFHPFTPRCLISQYIGFTNTVTLKRAPAKPCLTTLTLPLRPACYPVHRPQTRRWFHYSSYHN